VTNRSIDTGVKVMVEGCSQEESILLELESNNAKRGTVERLATEGTEEGLISPQVDSICSDYL